MLKLWEWVKANPIKTITTISTVLGSIITILTFNDQLYDALDRYVVTDDELVYELSQVQQEITEEFRTEASTIRNIYIDSLVEQTQELEHELLTAETEGEIYKILSEIDTIKERIRKLRGDNE